MWIFFNPNPKKANVGDCTVRAVSKSFNVSWEEAYTRICACGMLEGDMPSSNHVWGRYLKSRGYTRAILENEVTVREFALTHKGNYVLALQGHVVACVGGNWYDTWDSGDNTILYYWERTHEASNMESASR